MKGVFGVLLVGGGIFLLIALFNGTLKFPLGNVNILGSTISQQQQKSTPGNQLPNVPGKVTPGMTNQQKCQALGGTWQGPNQTEGKCIGV